MQKQLLFQYYIITFTFIKRILIQTLKEYLFKTEIIISQQYQTIYIV